MIKSLTGGLAGLGSIFAVWLIVYYISSSMKMKHLYGYIVYIIVPITALGTPAMPQQPAVPAGQVDWQNPYHAPRVAVNVLRPSPPKYPLAHGEDFIMKTLDEAFCMSVDVNDLGLSTAPCNPEWPSQIWQIREMGTSTSSLHSPRYNMSVEFFSLHVGVRAELTAAGRFGNHQPFSIEGWFYDTQNRPFVLLKQGQLCLSGYGINQPVQLGDCFQPSARWLLTDKRHWLGYWVPYNQS